MCHVGVSNEGIFLSAAIWLSNDCKWVFTEASLTPWCHAVVYFEVKMGPFKHVQENQKDLPRS